MAKKFPRRPRAQAEFLADLQEQRYFLRRSSREFDRGVHFEAKALATTIRLLVHEKRDQVSLLTRLGAKERMAFFDRQRGALLDARATVFYGVGIAAGPRGHQYVADLRPLIKAIPFDQWWDAVIFVERGHRHTRRDMVLNVAETDGGAHVDDALEEPYASVSRDFASLLTTGFYEPSGQFVPGEINSPVPSAIRQIAFELETSIDARFPENRMPRQPGDDPVRSEISNMMLVAYPPDETGA